jgi:hypothetical protein
VFADIAHIFREFHYKGDHFGGGITTCFSLQQGGRIIGGAVLGKPRHAGPYSDDGKKVVVEIRRMACPDDAPKNTESYFLGKIIWYLKKNTDVCRVISYADQTVGHVGTIYKAANFTLIGETGPTTHVFWEGRRYHPRSLSIERPYSHQIREAVKGGSAQVIQGKPKLVYQYDIRRKP